MAKYLYEPLKRKFAFLPKRTESGKLRWLCFLYREKLAHELDLGYFVVSYYYTKDEAVIKKLQGKEIRGWNSL